jgi:flagellar M-ring protein FliF
MRRAVVVLSAAGTFAAVLLLARVAMQPSMALLYAGLDPAAAGEVVRALEAEGVVHEVRGAAIYVEAARRDALRLTLAADGLPAAGAAGYELLDSLSGFGTTAQMFDAAYWRAKEGELARTIATSPAVRAARVHIAVATVQPFRRDLAPSASVALTPAGAALPAGLAEAVRHLVAAAVPGLGPEGVAVIDAATGAVLGGDPAAALAGAAAERAAQLREAVTRLLEARVGPGRAVVEVSLEPVTDREEIRERRIDPESRVAVSQEAEERSETSNETRPGAVTVASNLPEGEAAGDGGRAQSQSAETRERTTWDLSATSRELVRGPGGVRRLTVAVLVDGVRGTDADGNPTWEPRPEDELAALRELVASAVGYDEARGDVITLRSMQFADLATVGTVADAPTWAGFDPMTLVQVAVLALVALLLGLFVLRPILAPRSAARGLPPPGPAPLGLAPPGTAGTGAAALSALDGEIDDGPAPSVAGLPQARAADLPALPRSGPAAADGGADGALVPPDPPDPVERLRRLIAERQAETVEILRGWMDERGERA